MDGIIHVQNLLSDLCFDLRGICWLGALRVPEYQTRAQQRLMQQTGQPPVQSLKGRGPFNVPLHDLWTYPSTKTPNISL